MLTEGSFARNMYWRGIDKSGEYVRLVRALGGVVVNLDGSEGMINPLEVMATVTDKEGKVVDEVASFMQHLDKVSVLFKMVNRDFAEIEIKILKTFYVVSIFTTDYYLKIGNEIQEKFDLREKILKIILPFRNLVDMLINAIAKNI